MIPNRPWDSVSDSYVRANYAVMTAKDIGQHIGRTASAVIQRAKKLGVADSVPHWSDEQIDYIRTHYHTDGGLAVAKSLGKSLGSIHQKAHDIGLTDAGWSESDDSIMRSRYPTEGASTGLSELLGRSKNGLRMRAIMLGISYDGPCKLIGLKIGRKSHNWEGFLDPEGRTQYDIPKRAYTHCRASARKRRISFLLNIHDIHTRLVQQNGICAKTGLPVSFLNKSASVDRIDANGPYSFENIRITTIMANLCQGAFSDAEMDAFCLDYVIHNNLTQQVNTCAIKDA